MGKANGSSSSNWRHDDDSDADGGISQTKYSPEDFIYPGQDHQGHSERIWCRVQPMYDRQIDIVVKSKKFPFKTKGDLIRWAVCQGLKHLDRLEPMPGFLGRADQINQLCRDEIYFIEFMEMFQNMEKVIGQHLSMNAKTEATRMVAKAKAEALKIEEPFWREKCLEEISKRFGHLLGGGKRASLGNADTDTATGDVRTT